MTALELLKEMQPVIDSQIFDLEYIDGVHSDRDSVCYSVLQQLHDAIVAADEIKCLGALQRAVSTGVYKAAEVYPKLVKFVGILGDINLELYDEVVARDLRYIVATHELLTKAGMWPDKDERDAVNGR